MIAGLGRRGQRQDVTLTGRVLDNLSGVPRAAVRVDGGALSDLALDAPMGNFTLPTASRWTARADGSHTVTLIAPDAAGNIMRRRSTRLHARHPGAVLTLPSPHADAPPSTPAAA